VEPEPIHQNTEIAEFERELRQAFERRPAPPGLKSRIVAARNRRRTDRIRHRMVVWQRLAAAVVLVAALAGGFAWRQVQQRRKGEEARREVLTALRITQRTLNQINARLAARSQADQDTGHAQGDTE
jgi:hypothetical protein